MMKYHVLRPDVWGNQEDGWEVNDSYTVGSIDIDDVDNDDGIVLALIAEDILAPDANSRNIEIDGDKFFLYIYDKETFRPLIHLSLDYEAEDAVDRAAYPEDYEPHEEDPRDAEYHRLAFLEDEHFS